MLQASDIRIPVEVDLGSTFEEINALSEKFKELQSKMEGKMSVELKGLVTVEIFLGINHMLHYKN